MLNIVTYLGTYILGSSYRKHPAYSVSGHFL